MKPQVLKMANTPGASFELRRDQVPVNNRWHYHKEVELIYVISGSGTLLIGNRIRSFSAGTLCMIGAGIPHYWRFDDQYFGFGKVPIDVIAIHFPETFWGQSFLDLPENKDIRQLLERAKKGILIQGSIKSLIPTFQYMLSINGPYRIISLIALLSKIARWPTITYLLPEQIATFISTQDEGRINTIYNYTMKHFKRAIRLLEIAEIAGVTPNAFCRYFKQQTQKTYSQFIIELRVSYACKQLEETDRPIKSLSLESGFANIASFRRFFKIITGLSPLSYQKAYKVRTTS
ncbi:AraC family transcriptional regulator [Niabella pedocola]|uniref:AraC family transcriptional regulator n=1 Tax=Niabella pedocola TaxID=1752077 RepID=A0ABS8PP07_9BACT|nr:AraC family transcriptional regulator [Niabella pedocola]MCD2422605.1 AraC family transcriptional regulator [Niabella pedocola]